jgi:hypothetical protein
MREGEKNPGFNLGADYQAGGNATFGAPKGTRDICTVTIVKGIL